MSEPVNYLAPDQRRRIGNALLVNQFDRPTYYDQAPVERAGLLPLGTYPNGQTGLAFPGFITEPIESWNRMYEAAHAGEKPSAEDAFNVAGAAMVGGLASPRTRVAPRHGMSSPEAIAAEPVYGAARFDPNSFAEMRSPHWPTSWFEDYSSGTARPVPREQWNPDTIERAKLFVRDSEATARANGIVDPLMAGGVSRVEAERIAMQDPAKAGVLNDAHANRTAFYEHTNPAWQDDPYGALNYPRPPGDDSAAQGFINRLSGSVERAAQLADAARSSGRSLPDTPFLLDQGVPSTALPAGDPKRLNRLYANGGRQGAATGAAVNASTDGSYSDAGPAPPPASTSPIGNYTNWINAALGARDTGNNALFDPFEFQGPGPDETVDRPVRRDEVRAAPEPVWPPQSWWDERGVMPSYQKRVGDAQAFAANALDWWGLPSAILNRLSPEASASVRDIKAAHPTASIGGSIAGAMAGAPALRWAGNKLAERGHGTLVQGGADATTAVGLGMTSDAIRGDLPTGMGTAAAAQHIAPVAMASRVFMPNFPDSVVKRAAIGAGAGLIPGITDMSISGNVNAPILDATIGGMLAAAGRPSGKLPNYKQFRDDPTHATMRENYRTYGFGIPSALGTGSTIATYAPSTTELTPLTTQAAQEFDMTRHLPEFSTRFPPARPYIQEEYGYLEPRWPPRAPVLNPMLEGDL